MKQSRLMSLIESGINILVGFGISLAAQAVFLPLLGVQVSFAQNFIFALIMTVISIARSYLLRRLFEALHIRTPLSPALLAIAAERRRQIEQEGWTPEHDDTVVMPGHLALAGACYGMTIATRAGGSHLGPNAVPMQWPWHRRWWKPTDDRRDLVKGGALFVAELEKLDRQRYAPKSIALPAFLPRKGAA